MYLEHESRRAILAQRQRLEIQRRGKGPSGDPLWSSEEDRTCFALFPDYAALTQALKRRSKLAIQCRCQRLGLLTRSHRPYTAKEVSELRRAYARDDYQTLREKFSHRTARSLSDKASTLGLRRLKAPYKQTGDHLLDGLRAHCRAENITMGDLDEFAKSRSYFRQSGWKGGFNYHHIVRAIYELGGKLRIEWPDQ